MCISVRSFFNGSRDKVENTPLFPLLKHLHFHYIRCCVKIIVLALVCVRVCYISITQYHIADSFKLEKILNSQFFFKRTKYYSNQLQVQTINVLDLDGQDADVMNI